MNMGKWIAQETMGEFDSLPSVLEGLTTIEVSILAENLAENKSIIIHEDWQALIARLSDLPNVPSIVLAAVQHVRGEPALHEKFWRYMALFASVVNSNQQ